ncbi:MAG TPA: LCP family protein [Fimbriimonadaceae bacterium]|nr:LCP family protein [Fimbriimonadaceae bacterium]
MTRKKKPKPLWRKIVGGVFYAAFCACALAVGTGYRYISDYPAFFNIIVHQIRPAAPEETFNKDSLTLLLLGVDEDRSPRTKQILKEQARSDMMLVARLDFKANQVTGVSIPRDTLLALPGYRTQKINAYHAIGGRELAERAVEFLLGVGIDRTVVIDYKALQDMVDLVGGVEINVEKRLKYHDNWGDLHVDLKPGLQTLNGYQAMGYVRIRKSDDDFHRQERQKQFLLAFKEAMQKNVLVSPQVIQKAADSLGGALTDEEIGTLSHFARKVGGDNIRLGVIPTEPAGDFNLRVRERDLYKTLIEYHLIGNPSSGSRVSYR